MDILAGAAAGQAFALLYAGVSSLVTKSLEFKPRLRQIGEKLKSLEQLGIQRREVGLLAEERDKFKSVWLNGTHLVDELSKVHEWSFFKIHYNGQLDNLEKSLERQLMILQALQAGVMEAAVSIENTKAVNPEERGLLFNRVGDEVPKPPSYCVGLDGPLDDLRTKLVNGDQVSMLSVTAPGDSGKTALARMFYHDQQVKEKFNNRIFFEKVSINPDLNVLKASLQKFLDQTKDNHPALLILDDVWPHTSKTLLEELSVFSEGSVYKVLVTSRIMSKYGYHYPLNPLTNDDAIRLLKASSSLRDDQCSHDHRKCLEQIVKYCNRSPLVITKIGKSLISRDDIESWKAKVAELIKDPFIPLKTDGLFDSLKLSLDGLGQDKEKIKECFIDLASFPEDRKIHTGALIDIWAELYGVDDDGLSIAILRQLNQNNLANIVDTSTEKSRVHGCYSEHFVTQQSKLRKLALYLRDNSVGKTKRLNIDIRRDNSQRHPDVKMPEEIDLLSITTEEEFSSKCDRDDVNLLKAKVLVLNFQTKNYALPKFKKEMSKSLKVLALTNYGSFDFKLDTLKLLGSLPKLKRLRLERININSKTKQKRLKCIAVCSTILTKKVKVESLEKISFYMCTVGKAFSNKTIHFFQALPNLVEINIDYCNDLAYLPADLCTLRLLKKLIITNCHKLDALPEKMGDLRTCLEDLRVRSCIGLKRLPDSITRLEKLLLLDLFHCLNIEELPKDTGNIRSLRKINMEHCDKLKELPKSVSQLVQLEEVACDEEIKGQWTKYLRGVKFAQVVIKEKHGLEWLNT